VTLSVPDIDTRYVVFLLWGFGTLAIYTIVVVDRAIRWWTARDARARREALQGVGLFLTAAGSFLAIFVGLFVEPGNGIRTAALGLALGAFTGTGIVMLESPRLPRWKRPTKA
jgi:hypothetical protein